MKNLLASASFLILSSAGVLAADLPMNYKSPAPVVAPVFSWTGCYVGVHGGGGAMLDTFNNRNGTGGLAGGQVGCNYQDGNWVFGGEAEGYWSGIKSTRASSAPFINGEGFRDTDTVRNKSDFSIAARAGMAFDRTFVYGKAGWVWGKFDFNETDIAACCSSTGGSFLSTEAASATLNGLLLGVGVEHAITRNVTVKLEYNFLRYGGKELNFVSCTKDSNPACSTFTNTQSADKHIFKIGANYLFNVGGAPLVSKY